MEPAVKPAAHNSRSGVIGILATKATLEGALFKETSLKYGQNVKIISSVGEGFVELVESGQENSEEAYCAVSKCVSGMIDGGADHIVLGCTHYPFLTDTIKKVIGDRDIAIVDPAPAIALRVKSLLEQNGLLAIGDISPEYLFYSAREDEYSEKLKSKAMSLVNR
jgi:glutamate racemase